MIINKILIIIIIIILLFLHNNNNKYIEKFSLTDNIKTVVNKIYNNELEPIISLSNFLNQISKGNDLQIYSNLNVNNVYSKKDIKNNNISLNTMKSNTDNYINHLNNTYDNIDKINENLIAILPSHEKYLSTYDFISYEIAQNSNNEYKLTVHTGNDTVPMIDNRIIHRLPGTISSWGLPFVYKWKIKKA